MLMSPRQRFELLDELSRVRALTEAESREMEVLMRRIDGTDRGDRRPWSRDEDRALLLVDRSVRGWPKAMAPIFQRTEGALRCRAYQLEQAE